MTPRLTLSLGLRYDLEIIPLAETDNPLVESYPVDKNNFQPRLGVTYDLGGGKSVVRGGYGRFYDKTHFELIGGIYTGTPFTNSFLVNFPTSAADAGPRNGRAADRPVPGERPGRRTARCSTSSSRRAGCCGTPARAGTTPIAARPTPTRSPRLRAPARREPGGERRLRARLEPRPADAAGPEPGPARDDGGDVAAGAAAECHAERGLRRRCARPIPGFANFTTAVTQPLNVGKTRLRCAAAQRQQALRPQLRDARLVHAVEVARQHDRQRRRRPAASRCSTT